MTTPVLNKEWLMALARAYDREDAAQRGEPDPWADVGQSEADSQWVAERIACAEVGLAAYLSAYLPADVAGVVATLERHAVINEEMGRVVTGQVSAMRQAAALISALSADNARLMEGGWQPIETAPNDGTWILLFVPGHGPARARWNKRMCGWQSHETGREITKGTDWMAMPPAPAARSVAKEAGRG